jgi:hypothetical protein
MGKRNCIYVTISSQNDEDDAYDDCNEDDYDNNLYTFAGNKRNLTRVSPVTIWSQAQQVKS